MEFDLAYIAIIAFLGLCCLVGGGVGMVVTGFLTDIGNQRRFNEINADIIALQNSIKAQKSVLVKEERNEEMQMALAEATDLFQSEDPDKMKKIAALAMKYPSAAKVFMKKFGLGDMLRGLI